MENIIDVLSYILERIILCKNEDINSHHNVAILYINPAIGFQSSYRLVLFHIAVSRL